MNKENSNTNLGQGETAADNKNKNKVVPKGYNQGEGDETDRKFFPAVAPGPGDLKVQRMNKKKCHRWTAHTLLAISVLVIILMLFL